MKVDAVCVTRGDIPEWWYDNLGKLPLNDVIYETSTPISRARKRAIGKVSTPWFVFLDDDMELGPEWWSQIMSLPLARVGAIHGETRMEGLTPFDEEISQLRQRGGLRCLSEGDRGWTHNTMIRTEAVRDWQPPPLSAYEDWHLTQHILSKGLKWISTPLDATHHRTWDDLTVTGKTAGQAYKQLFGRWKAITFLTKLLAVYLREKVFPSSPAEKRLVEVQNPAIIEGLLT